MRTLANTSCIGGFSSGVVNTAKTAFYKTGQFLGQASNVFASGLNSVTSTFSSTTSNPFAFQPSATNPNVFLGPAISPPTASQSFNAYSNALVNDAITRSKIDTIASLNPNLLREGSNIDFLYDATTLGPQRPQSIRNASDGPLGDFAGGVANSVVNTLEGFGQLITHPIDSARAIKDSATTLLYNAVTRNPIDNATSVYNSAAQYVSSKVDKGYVGLGEVTGDIAQSFLGGAFGKTVSNSVRTLPKLNGSGARSFEVSGNVTLSRGAELRTKFGTQFDEYARFREQGFTPAQSKYLTQPYDNGKRSGHHFPIPQRVGRDVLPDAIVDSRFNVLKPRNINLGRFYELHYRVDPDFHGAAFPRAIGGSWRGSQLGLQEYTGLPRVWHGTPGPLKAAGGAAAGIGGAGAYWWTSSNPGE